MNEIEKITALLVEDDDEDALIFSRHVANMSSYRVKLERVSQLERAEFALSANHFDIVSNEDDLNQVISQIRAAIEDRAFQPQLPSLESAPVAGDRRGVTGHLRRETDGDEIVSPPVADSERIDDLYFHYLRLTDEVGQLGAQIARMWASEHQYEDLLGNRIESRQRALDEHLPLLRDELGKNLRRLVEIADLTESDIGSLFDSDLE